MLVKLKQIQQLIFYLFSTVLVIYIGLMLFWPQQIRRLVPYSFYAVLSESMEPRIPVYSLVCVKKFTTEKVNLKPQEIITFKANRFGHEIVLTHYFNKTEVNDAGQTIYRTNAEDAPNLDAYQTTRKNLIGSYVFHLPYLGKILLFLQSKYGWILWLEWGSILGINLVIRSFWKEVPKKSWEKRSFNRK